MDSNIIVRKEDGSADTWYCRDLALGDVLTRERQSHLGEAYVLWVDLAHPSLMQEVQPLQPAAAPLSIADCDIALSEVFYVDCERRNPFNFRITLPGVPERHILIGEIAPDHVRRVLALDMNYAKGYRRPLYQYIHQVIDGASRECYRLLLPVLGSAGHVSQIYGYCRTVVPQLAPRKRLPHEE